ncbi:MAG TPA: hypothetical protein VM369_00850 [Candidatus Binatia bacterium]|nr:hypothetical protein [Candidatus Binatia bacterium]
MRLLAPALLCIAAPLCAQTAAAATPADTRHAATPKADTPRAPGLRFGKYDDNLDGMLTPAEISRNEGLRAKFTNLDRDHDMKLSPAEFAQMELQAATPAKAGEGE